MKRNKSQFPKNFESDGGAIRITRSKRDGTIAYYQNGCFHSQANLQGISICGYVHVMQEIIRQSHAREVLIIGCAGGTLATMLRRLHCRVTVVDIDFLAFVIARRYFRLPDDVRCVRRDGIAYLRTTKKKYDAIAVDVFDSHNAIPRAFTTESFFQKIRKVLLPSGIMVMNVITANDEDGRADRIAQNAQATGMKAVMFDWPGQKNRNTLIATGISRRVRIPSGREPAWIKPDLQGIVRRRPETRRYIWS